MERLKREKRDKEIIKDEFYGTQEDGNMKEVDTEDETITCCGK